MIQELKVLKKLVQLTPQDNLESGDQFLSIFDCTESTLDKQACQASQEIFNEFQDLFAKHRFEIDVNNDLKVKFKAVDGSPTFSQSLPTSMNLKDDFTKN